MEKSTYVCMGSCQTVVSENDYKNGANKCGTPDCTHHGQPLVEGERSEATGRNVTAEHMNHIIVI